MIKAQLVTIGTEITSGEVVNSNAAWVSLRLEDRGVRVYSHFTVRDQHEEILRALDSDPGCDLVVVTGGLGPTSDDITRECLAQHFAVPLDFSEGTWTALSAMYTQRKLPLREAHRHQCFFPRGAELMQNPAGTALGFAQKFNGRNFFVLPGPPRELEAMWNAEVEPRLESLLPENPFHWVYWTCLGVPESEVAELVEKVIAGSGIEVGYRATVPYVKIKLYVDNRKLETRAKIEEVEMALKPYLVGRGREDLAEEFLRLWPAPVLRVVDLVSETNLIQRLFSARRNLTSLGVPAPELEVLVGDGTASSSGEGVSISAVGEEFTTRLRVERRESLESKKLPYNLSLGTERGKRSVAEWALWNWVKALRASSRQP